MMNAWQEAPPDQRAEIALELVLAFERLVRKWSLSDEEAARLGGFEDHEWHGHGWHHAELAAEMDAPRAWRLQALLGEVERIEQGEEPMLSPEVYHQLLLMPTITPELSGERPLDALIRELDMREGDMRVSRQGRARG